MPNGKSASRRHAFIPDCQVRPGVPLDHLDWIAEALLHYQPDVVVEGGDFWDMPSLNSHSSSKELEGTRYKADIQVGNRAFARLFGPLEKEVADQKRRRLKNAWTPELHKLFGNHEGRILRAVEIDPRLEGTISTKDCDTRGFVRHKFLKRVWLDNICYAHFFQSSHSAHAIGGSVDNRLNKIGCSFVQGHEQGFRYGIRITASGKTFHGIVAGSCYLHVENYRGAQGQEHFRGIIILNEVRNGDFCIMPLSLDYLCRRSTGLPLVNYMRAKYPKQNWDHLA